MTSKLQKFKLHIKYLVSFR